MRLNLTRSLTVALCFSLAGSPALLANSKDAAKQAAKASNVFQEIMAAPDRAIPEGVLDKAQCVAIFPQVLKAGFIFGGRLGRGVASCRVENGWSYPAYFELKGGSFGLQIGAQATDFVLLFMNHNGMRTLLKDKFEMGGDASVAAGPVGREAGASTDALLNSEILSYSRSKGLFAGLELKGAVITLDSNDMESTYGAETRAEEVLTGRISGPQPVKVYPDTLDRYSRHKM